MSGGPFAGLPPVERARRIANSLLLELDAEGRAVWTERAHAVGETWLGASLVTVADDATLTTREAAQLLCVSEGVIRQWAWRPHPEHPDRPLLPQAGRKGRQRTYLVRSLRDAAAAVRRARLRGSARSGQHPDERGGEQPGDQARPGAGVGELDDEGPDEQPGDHGGEGAVAIGHARERGRSRP